MSDIAMDFLRKILRKEVKLHNPLAEEAIQLKEKVTFEEEILANKIKLKTITSITSAHIDEAFNESELDEYIKTIILTKIAAQIKNQAYYIVNTALDDLDDDYEVTSNIRSSIISKIKGIF